MIAMAKRHLGLLAASAVIGLVFAVAFLRHAGWTEQSAFLAKLAPGSYASHAHAGSVRPDAHKIKTADEFLPHFKAVMERPGMTMAEAKSGCTWTDEEYAATNFQFGPGGDAFGLHMQWVEKDYDDWQLDVRRRQMHKFIKTGFMPYEKHVAGHGGRGIVVVGGHGKSLKRMKVVIRALERLGCTLPIELHYYGDEMSEEQKSNVSTMWPHIILNDLSSSSTNILKTMWSAPGRVNYQLKTAALINSRFDEVLMIDSDNVPAINPEELFESDVYQEYGTLFWPDIARTRRNNPMWAITNTACRMDEFELESGQFMVDKRKYFYHLQLADWFNNSPENHDNITGDYYNNFLLGDKDLFRFAWHALKTPYGYPSKWLSSIGTLSDGYYCGHTFGQYAPDGRIAFLHGGLLKGLKKPVLEWQRSRPGGIFQVHKTSAHNQDFRYSENVGIKWSSAEYLPNRPADMQAAWCADMFDVEPRNISELGLEGFGQLYDEIGGFWQLDDCVGTSEECQI